jgi:hypothetical protein
MQWTSPLTDGQILGVMSDDGRGLLRGCYWGETSRHAALDIDHGSEYHSSQALTKLLQDFAAVGLTLVPYRSSESGGWHLYCYFDSAVLSQEVETTIKNYLKARRYEIRSGTLEVFPSGNALRLPLQQGFGWLCPEGNLEISREELTEGQALVLLFNDMEENKRNWSEAKNRIERAISEIERSAGASVQEHEKAIANQGFDGLFQKGLDWEKWERGRNYWHLGLTEKSQRHDAIHCVGHYLWYGDEASGVRALPGQTRKGKRAAEIAAWLEAKHNGQSEEVNRGRQREVAGDIERAVSWTSQAALVKEYEPYRMTDRMIDRLMAVPHLCPDDLRLANERREKGARRKIRQALTEMLSQGEHPTVKSLVKATGCRKETVRRHSDIWRIYAMHPSTLGMSKGLGDYIAGGHGGPCGSLQLAASSEFLFPIHESCGSQEVLGEEGVSPTGIKSLDHCPSFEVFSSAEVTPVLGCKSEVPDREPSRELVEICHDRKIPLVLVGEAGFSAGPSKVAPLFHAWQESLVDSSQNQAQALQVPAASLTLGPELSAIQALRHVTAGGILLSLSVCYSDGTKYGVRAQTEASSERGALVSFWGGRKENQTVLDATNYSHLTIDQSSLWSKREEILSFLLPCRKNSEIDNSEAGRSSSGAVSFRCGNRKPCVDSISTTDLELLESKKVPIFIGWQACRQLGNKQYRYFTASAGRGPPTAHKPLVLV